MSETAENEADVGEAFPRVTVGGNAEGGWLVEIHDGNTSQVFRPEAATAQEALSKAKQMYDEANQPPPPPAPPIDVAAFDALQAENEQLKADYAALMAKVDGMVQAQQAQQVALEQVSASQLAAATKMQAAQVDAVAANDTKAPPTAS